MKKLLLLILSLLIVFALCACGGNPTTEPCVHVDADDDWLCDKCFAEVDPTDITPPPSTYELVLIDDGIANFVFVFGNDINAETRYKVTSLITKLQKIGVSTVICTDIFKDGAMQGTNRELYKELSEKFSVNIIASGGVSTLDDITALNKMKLFGAIIGKAYYTGAIKISDALEAVK